MPKCDPADVLERVLSAIVSTCADKDADARGQSGGPECDAEGGAQDVLWAVCEVLQQCDLQTEGAASCYRATRGIYLPDIDIES